MPDSYVSRPGGQINPQRSLTGVRHLTEDLIKNVAKDTSLDSITVLKLNFSELSGKKIKVIENLDKLKKLHTLNLSGNQVEKLERLDGLAKLKDLDLSDNQIVKIEGLENLGNLISLNLEGNQIECVPTWMCKKLRSLRNLRLANNRMESLQEIRKLRGLPNLSFLTVLGNPFCELPHYRLFIVFHLRSLEVLDGKRISPQERIDADKRFGQEEIDVLHTELLEAKARHDQLKNVHDKSVHDLQNSQVKDEELVQLTRDQEERIKQLISELDAKEGLIARKQAELSRANQKHYELEQELAFYKIDTKFTSLHKKPETPSVMEEFESLMESPYIGKSQHVKDKPSWPLNQKKPLERRVHSARPDSIDSLEDELNNKKRDLEVADKRLAELTDELEFTEKRVADAAELLLRMTSILSKPKSQPLNPAAVDKLEEKRGNLQKTVDELENNREQLVENLDKNAEDISEAEQIIDDLDKSLDASDLEDSEKDALLAEKEDKENFLVKAKEMKEDLEQALVDLEQVLEQKKKELERVEERLAASDELGPEANEDITNVAEEVKDLLKSMKRGPDSNKELQLLRERLAEMERAAEAQAQQQSKLEKSLMEETAENESLQRQLMSMESKGHPSKETDERIQKQLNESQAAKERLKADLAKLRYAAESTEDKYHKHLEQLQKENERIRQALESKRLYGNTEVEAVLDNVIEGVKSGELRQPNSADPIEQKVALLYKTIDNLNQRAKNESRNLRKENDQLKEQLAVLDNVPSDASGSESSALIDGLKQELKSLRRSLLGETKLRQRLTAVSEQLRRTQSELSDAKLLVANADNPRTNPHKLDRYSKPPMFNIDEGLDDSLGDSTSTKDTVRRQDQKQRRPTSAVDEADRGASGQGSISQNSGRATDENPRTVPPSRQNTARLPPHPDDVMSINSEVPVPYKQPKYPNPDSPLLAPTSGAANAGRMSERKRSPVGVPGLDTVPETYESDLDYPRGKAPVPSTETKLLKNRLKQAEDEVMKLQKLLNMREKDLDTSIHQVDRANSVIKHQNRMLEQTDAELQAYKQEVERLRSLLAGQGHPSGEGIRQPTSSHSMPNLHAGSPAHNPDPQRAFLQDTSTLHTLPGYTDQKHAGSHHTDLRQLHLQQLDPQQLDPQLSTSFMQGPSVKPGDFHPNGQVMTSTPYRPHIGGPQIAVQPGSGHAGDLQLLQSVYNLPLTSGAQTGIQLNPQGSLTGSAAAALGGMPSRPYAVPSIVPGHLAPMTNAMQYVTQAPVGLDKPTVVLSATGSSPKRGILKSSDRQRMMCSVPEHHDLEDQLDMLRRSFASTKESHKVLKIRSRSAERLASHAKAASQLKHALKERRTELESLDLAINSQREQLALLKDSFKKSEKSGLHDDLLEHKSSHDIKSVENYLQSEVECLESTLRKRRAELREADARLQGCRKDLAEAREEAQQLIDQFELVSEQLGSNQQQLAILEEKRQDKEKEVAELMVEAKRLSDRNEALQEQLDQTDSVTKEREKNQADLVQQIEHLETVLGQLQAAIRLQTSEAELRLQEIKSEAERHVQAIRQSEAELNRDLQDAISLKSTKKRFEIGSMSKVERELTDKLDDRKELLDRIKEKVEDGKEVLKGLSESVEQKEDQFRILKKSLHSARAESADVLREVSERRLLLESLNTESKLLEQEVSDMKGVHAEARKVLDRLESSKHALCAELENTKAEKDSLLIQCSQKSSELEAMNKHYESVKAKLSEVSQAHSQVDKDFTEKTAELELIKDSMKQVQKEYEVVKQAKYGIQYELETLRQTVRDQKSHLSKLKKSVKDLENKKSSYKMDCEKMELTIHELHEQISKVKNEYQFISSRLLESKSLLSEHQQTLSELKQDVNRLEIERGERQRTLKELTAQYEKDSQHFTDITERAERELSQMRDQQEHCQTRVSELMKELSRLTSEITRYKKEHSDMMLIKTKLTSTEQELETERSTNADLMKRLTEFTQRLQARNDSLTTVKKQSDEQIKSLINELNQHRQEWTTLNNKYSKDVEDLELIAQGHAQRAERLELELVSTQDQLQLLKTNIATLENIGLRDEKLNETLSNIKTNIQQEVSQGIAELEKSRADAMVELEELRAQKSFIANEVIALKENLEKVQNNRPEQPRQFTRRMPPSPKGTLAASAKVREKINTEQEMIRKQMQEQIQRHLAAMEGMKSHSMSILSDLQDRVTSLQGVLSESTTSLNSYPGSVSPSPESRIHFRAPSPHKRIQPVRDS